MLKADRLLESVAETLRERDAVYGQNDEVTGRILSILFPDGIKLVSPEDHRMFHFLGHIIGKLTRFTNSGMKHEDSLHDLMGYAALAAGLIESHNIELLQKWRHAENEQLHPVSNPSDRPDAAQR
jgi:hypothetical protein